jgi:hypothetical protein
MTLTRTGDISESYSWVRSTDSHTSMFLHPIQRDSDEGHIRGLICNVVYSIKRQPGVVDKDGAGGPWFGLRRSGPQFLHIVALRAQVCRLAVSSLREIVMPHGTEHIFPSCPEIELERMLSKKCSRTEEFRAAIISFIRPCRVQHAIYLQYHQMRPSSFAPSLPEFPTYCVALPASSVSFAANTPPVQRHSDCYESHHHQCL